MGMRADIWRGWSGRVRRVRRGCYTISRQRFHSLMEGRKALREPQTDTMRRTQTTTPKRTKSTIPGVRRTSITAVSQASHQQCSSTKANPPQTILTLGHIHRTPFESRPIFRPLHPLARAENPQGLHPPRRAGLSNRRGIGTHQGGRFKAVPHFVLRR